MMSAHSRGRWLKVGVAPIRRDLSKAVRRYKQDAISGKLFTMVNGDEVPATRAQCKKLECAAVWSPEHVEDRLRDHFAGRSNVWLESLRPK